VPTGIQTPPRMTAVLRGSMAGLCLPAPALRCRPRARAARLEAGVVRITFTVKDFHPPSLPVSRRTPASQEHGESSNERQRC
jgi:hypothetical protein